MKIGMVVQLRSGGPLMTIKGQTSKEWLCVWFLPDGQAVSGQFSEEMLREAKEPST